MAGWPTGSFVGVDVFFVISGYLITGILVREFETRQTISFRGFYARRIKRILPAGLFVVGATVCATGCSRESTATTPPPPTRSRRSCSPPTAFRPDRRQLLQPVAAAVTPPALLVPVGRGAVLLRMALAHAGPAADRSPPAVLAARAHPSGRGRRDRSDLRHLLAWAFAQTAQDPTAAYFSTFVRAWELGAGALVAIAAQPIARWDARLRRVVASVGLLGVLCSLFVVPASSGFPAPWALLPTLSTAAVLAGRRRPLGPVAAPADQSGQASTWASSPTASICGTSRSSF